MARAEGLWTLGVGAVAFRTPVILVNAVPTPPGTEAPEWVAWVVLLVWILAGTFGVALVIVGGRVRRIGKALIVGDALGILLLFILIIVTVSTLTTG